MHKKNILFAVTFLSICTLEALSYAQLRHGIAMHGEPEMIEGFSNLPYVNPVAPKGGKITYGETGHFDSLNPFILKGSAPFQIRTHTFESLLGRSWDEPFTLYGLLAKSVKVPNDRSFITFYVNPRARFSDNSPVTVDDVRFSFETLRDKGRPNFANAYNKVSDVRTTPKSITFTFKEPDRELPLILGLMPVLSKDSWQDKSFEESTSVPLIGSGPYVVSRVDQGRSITFERNKNYWGSNLPLKVGHDNFDRITYEYFRDRQALVEAFKAGIVNYMQESDPIRWQSAYPEGIKKEVIPHQRPTGMKGFVFNTRRPMFNDIRVRQALTMMFDFEWLNRVLYNETYTRIQSYFDHSPLGYKAQALPAEIRFLQPWLGELPSEILSTKIVQPSTDGSGRNRLNQRKALTLLKEAGWILENGQLKNKLGQTFNFEILMTLSGEERIATLFRKSLQSIGINVTVRTVDNAQYQKRLVDYDYDMTVYAWGLSLSPGNEQSFYWGGAGRSAPGTRNYMGVDSPVIDDLISKMLEVTTKEDFTAAVHALDRVLTNGRYVIPFWYDPVDRVAWWRGYYKPDIVPLYGNRPETWWTKTPTDSMSD